MNQKIIIFLITCSISISAFADFVTDSELYVGTARYAHDDSRELKDAFSFEAGFELPVMGTLSWELWFSKYNADSTTTAGQQKTRRVSQGLLLHLNDGNTRSFITAGYGSQNFDGNGKKNSGDLFNLGLGFKTYLKSHFILRGEILTLHNPAFDSMDTGIRLSVGYLFGRKYVRKEDIPPFVEPEPEPIPEPLPEPKPEPIDSDNDGVVDGTDLCPDTDIAFKVDETGCPIMLAETVSKKMDIKFEFNSAKLSPDYYPEVEKLADFMKQFDETAVVIEGHSDSVGNNKYNKALSQRRAETIKQLLINKFGLSEERVTAIGYGEERPIADNTLPEGRALNRRVVAVVESTIETMSRK